MTKYYHPNLNRWLSVLPHIPVGRTPTSKINNAFLFFFAHASFSFLLLGTNYLTAYLHAAPPSPVLLTITVKIREFNELQMTYT